LSALAVEEWITHAMTTVPLSAEKVFSAPAPAGLGSGIIFKALVGRDGGTPQVRTLSVYRYLIACFEETDNLDTLGPRYKVVDQTLEGSHGETTNGTIHWCQREQEVHFDEPLENGQTRHTLGGIYRITVKGR
jgi:hypothetical protein